MKRLWAGIVAGGIVLGGMQTVSSADEADPPARAAPARDYGAGYEAFYQRGLPRIDQSARYVKLQAHGHNIQTHRPFQHLWDLQVEGTAWLIEELPDEVHRFVLLNGQTVTVMDRQVLQARRMERMREQAEGADVPPWDETMIGGTWEDADAAQDLQTILSYLEERSAQVQQMRRMTPAVFGNLFLAMAGYHAAGFTDDANRGIELLFDMGQDPRGVIAAGMDQLATLRYESAFQAFEQSRDWDEFGRSIAGLLDQFTTGWQLAPMVRMLSERIADRSAEAPPIAGLSESQQRLADSLMDAGRRQATPMTSVSRLWVLSEFDDPDDDGSADSDLHPLDRILRRGMAAVPLLIALLDDDRLTAMTPRDMTMWGGMHHHQAPRQPSERLTDEQVRQAYRRMNRPMERRDIARRLLEPLLLVPGDDGSRARRRQSMDDEEFAIEIEAWYDDHKAMTRTALARRYLTAGDNSQAGVVIPILTQSDDPEDHAVLETHFIEGLTGSGAAAGMRHRVTGQFHQIQNYVYRRGEAAAPFVDRYIATWEAAQAEPGEDSELETAVFHAPDAMRKQMEQHIKHLRLLVAAPAADILVQQWLDGEIEATDAMPLLQRFIREKSVAEVLDVFLPALLRVDDSPVGEAFLSMVDNWARSVPMRRMHDQRLAQTMPAPSDHADDWRKLLADRQTRIGSSRRCDRAARLMEWIFGDPAHLQTPRPVFWGDRLETLLIARADARLDGADEAVLPAYPEAADVDEAARTALGERLLAAGTIEQQRTVLAALTAAEELALGEILASKPELNRHFQPLTLLIEAGENEVDETAWLDRVDAFSGRSWNREVIEEAHQWAAELARQGHAIRLSIGKRVGISPLTVSIEPLPDGIAERHPMAGHSEGQSLPAAVRAGIRTRGVYVLADWDADTTSASSGRVAPATDPLDLLDMMEQELESVMDRRADERRVAYWQAVEAHPGADWTADQAFEATLETFPAQTEEP